MLSRLVCSHPISSPLSFKVMYVWLASSNNNENRGGLTAMISRFPIVSEFCCQSGDSMNRLRCS